MSDLDRFELFTYVAQLGGITQAAKKLRLTKASLSKQIKRLEVQLQTQLFDRHKRALQLTPQGEALLEQCLRLKRELDETRSICQQFNQEPQGRLHVVCFNYFARKLIFPRLKDFLKRYPKINMTIDLTERVPDFYEEQIDIAVGFSLPVPNPGEVIQKRMATTRYILCASPHYFKEMGKPKKLDDLQQHRYIAHTSRSIDQVIKLKPGYQIHLEPYLVINSVSAMIDCAKEGLGLVQLPLYVLEDSFKQGALLEVLPDYQASHASVYYHYPKRRFVQPKVRAFIDYFLETEESSKRI